MEDYMKRKLDNIKKHQATKLLTKQFNIAICSMSCSLNSIMIHRQTLVAFFHALFSSLLCILLYDTQQKKIILKHENKN